MIENSTEKEKTCHTMDNSLIFGDCMEEMKKLENGCVDLVLTDPPYVLPAKTSTSTKIGKNFIKRNLADFSITESYFGSWFSEIHRITKPTSKIIIFCDETFYTTLFRSAYQIFDLSMLIWKKNKVGLGRNYRKTFEVILYGKRENAVNFSEFRRDLFDVNVPSNKIHPTEKPVELLKYLIHPEKNAEVIFDPFMGVGTTGVAAKELGRKFIGIELNKVYYNHAVRRFNETSIIKETKDA